MSVRYQAATLKGVARAGGRNPPRIVQLRFHRRAPGKFHPMGHDAPVHSDASIKIARAWQGKNEHNIGIVIEMFRRAQALLQDRIRAPDGSKYLVTPLSGHRACLEF